MPPEPNSNNFFRPITLEEYTADKQQENRLQIEQQHFLHPQISRTLSASAAADVLNATHLLAPDHLNNMQPSEHLNLELMSHQQILQVPNNKHSILITSGREQIHSNDNSMQVAAIQNNNFSNFSQIIQPQLLQNNINRPCSASLPPNNNPEALSPSCYSLHDFHHAAGNLFTSSTPDTDLSTPGPPEIRNPHSASNLYNTNLSQFVAQQLANQNTHNNEQLLQSLVTISTEDVQRPMSLPNYGLQQLQQFQQQQAELSQHTIPWNMNNPEEFS